MNRRVFWVLLLTCVATAAVLVMNRRTRPLSPDQGVTQSPNEPRAQAPDETAATDTPRETVTPQAEAGRANEAVVPESGATGAPKGPSQSQALAQENPPVKLPPAGAQPRPALASSQQPEPGAELWSYDPLMQQNAATNFVRAMDQLARARSESERYLALDAAAKAALVFGKVDDARAYASELLALDQSFQGAPWRGGDAAHDGNLVLGRIALQEGRTDEAKQYLLAAGQSTGSPVLGSFGPNMTLARDLLQTGEQATVLQYFDLCRKFWGPGDGKLSEWTADVQAGRLPDFGANLYY